MRALVRRITMAVVVLPLAVVLIALALANRAPVQLSLDPFQPESPALSITVPLFIALFLALMAGVLIGGAASWAGQRKHRKENRFNRREAERLRAEADKLRGAQAPPAGLLTASRES